MRAIKYLKNRFEFAVKGNGSIRVNQNDIEAINSLVDYANGISDNENFEDSLILFWICHVWRLDIIENKLRIEKNPNEKYLHLTGLDVIMNKLTTMVNARDYMIDTITTDLQIAQISMGISKDKLIPKEDVEIVVTQAINTVKNFKTFDALKKYERIIMPESRELTDKQKQMLGL